MTELEKTVTRSFRISEVALKLIQEVAQRHNISVNALVNQILLSYVNFDRYTEKLSVVKLFNRSCLLSGLC